MASDSDADQQAIHHDLLDYWTKLTVDGITGYIMYCNPEEKEKNVPQPSLERHCNN